MSAQNPVVFERGTFADTSSEFVNLALNLIDNEAFHDVAFEESAVVSVSVPSRGETPPFDIIDSETLKDGTILVQAVRHEVELAQVAV